MITRRKLLLALGAGSLSVLLPAFGQQVRRVRRIGFFSGGSVRSTASWLAAFRAGMAELRWVDGRDYVIDARHESGGSVALAEAAAAMVASGPELILTTAEGTARPVIQSTKTIPIVFAMASDPVANGFAASLRRPGGNATGLSSLSRELAAKRVELLKKAFPRISRVLITV